MLDPGQVLCVFFKSLALFVPNVCAHAKSVLFSSDRYLARADK